jgi:branched-chain amino acid transport system permease protein
VEYFVAQLLNGLAAGSVYALIAIGYSMVYGILQLINFAHGDVYMFGTFVAMALIIDRVPIILAIPLACLAGAALGVTVERVAYRPLRDANRIAPTVSAIGAALILRNGAQTIWGTETRPFPVEIHMPVWRIGEIRIFGIQLLIFFIALTLMAFFSVFVKRFQAGKAMRAVAQDMPAAAMMGIPVNRIIVLVYALGSVMGVAGGILFGIYYNILFIGMGFGGTMKAFTAAVIGGIGNLYGAFLGGLLLGVLEAMAAGYISSAYRDAIAFGVLILILMFRPTGLLGARLSQKV